VTFRIWVLKSKFEFLEKQNCNIKNGGLFTEDFASVIRLVASCLFSVHETNDK
jgi:hypothetical protein